MLRGPRDLSLNGGAGLLALLAMAHLLCAEAAAAQEHGDVYQREIETWRRQRLESLTDEEGWLSLVGLFWLEEGANSVGSAPGSRVELPADKAPERVGTIFLERSKLRFAAAPAAPVLHAGEPVPALELDSDEPGPPTVLEVGDLVFYVIERGQQFGIRVKDRRHPARATFPGIDYFPVDRSWRIEGRFEPHEPLLRIPVPTVLGTVDEQPSWGAVAFERDGRGYRLDALAEPGAEELFLIFADETSGRETYGGGRYLYAAAPDAEGRVILDFNKAYNPPCAFTPFATCPLPPRQNRLPLRIEAGEKSYAAGH